MLGKAPPRPSANQIKKKKKEGGKKKQESGKANEIILYFVLWNKFINVFNHEEETAVPR